MPAKETKPAAAKTGKSLVQKVAPVVKGVAKKVAAAVKGGKAAAKGGKAGAKGGKVAAAKPVRRFGALFVEKKRNYGIGNDIQPKRDLTRFVRWPRYIRIQRQRKILMSRLKVPPSINQFSKTLDLNNVAPLFKLLNKYRPELPETKKARLTKVAKLRAKGKTVPASQKRPLAVTAGITQVVKAIESKSAKLVIIAHDVTPIELVVFLPNLCRKMDVPYAIVKGKARLGTVVHRKTCSALAVGDVRKEDRQEVANIAGLARELFNDNAEHRRQWGGGLLSGKSGHVLAKRQKAISREQRSKQ